MLSIFHNFSDYSSFWADASHYVAYGVEIAAFVTNNTKVIVSATQEVILSAGAYRSYSILGFTRVGNNNGVASADTIESILKIQYESIFESQITTEMLSQL